MAGGHPDFIHPSWHPLGCHHHSIALTLTHVFIVVVMIIFTLLQMPEEKREHKQAVLPLVGFHHGKCTIHLQEIASPAVVYPRVGVTDVTVYFET